MRREPRGGVAVFVVRGRAQEARVLLLERGHGVFAGDWCPVAGNVDGEERDAEAALRELREQIGLEPERFYATPVTEWVEEQGRMLRLSVFVAFVAADASAVLEREHRRAEWLEFAEARGRLPLEAQRSALLRVEAEFVRRRPDEALRLA